MKRIKRKYFKLPNAVNLKGRRSTIAKAFSDGIAPRLQPTEEEYEQFLCFFPKTDDRHVCAYCGGRFEYYEHFRPLVVETKPTGFGSDIYNLVPSCACCNQNKGNKDWKQWMEDKNNPGRNDDVAHRQRFLQLQEFEKWGEGKVIFIDYAEVVGAGKWNEYMDNYQRICGLLNEVCELQKSIRGVVVNEVKKMTV